VVKLEAILKQIQDEEVRQNADLFSIPEAELREDLNIKYHMGILNLGSSYYIPGFGNNKGSINIDPINLFRRFENRFLEKEIHHEVRHSIANMVTRYVIRENPNSFIYYMQDAHTSLTPPIPITRIGRVRRKLVNAFGSIDSDILSNADIVSAAHLLYGIIGIPQFASLNESFCENSRAKCKEYEGTLPYLAYGATMMIPIGATALFFSRGDIIGGSVTGGILACLGFIGIRLKMAKDYYANLPEFDLTNDSLLKFESCERRYLVACPPRSVEHLRLIIYDKSRNRLDLDDVY